MNGGEQQPSGPDSGWQYKPESDFSESLTPGYEPQQQSVVTHYAEGDARNVQWSASEYIAHEKNVGWYALFTIGSILFIALIYLISKDPVTTIALGFTALLFAVAAGRKPRQLNYAVDDNGLTIGRRLLPYSDFKSFAIVEDGPFASLVFMPVKRFLPVTSAYLDPNDEEAIISVVANHLPVVHHQADLIERALKHIRF